MPALDQFSIPSAHNVTAQIDGALSATPGRFQFPEDLPKYYTTITLSEHRPLSQGGAAGAAQLASAYNQIADWLMSNSPTGVTGPVEDVANSLRSAARYLGISTESLAPAAVATGDTIILPLPLNIVDVHQVKYDEKPIAPWSLLLGGIAGSFTGTLFGTAAGAIAGNVAGRVGFGLAGLAPNDYWTILFDRPMFKRHELHFKLAPRNYRESQAIRDIVQVLHNAEAPDVAGPLFRFPNLLTVKYHPNEYFLHGFKPAVLESMAINFCGGNNTKAFYHGQQNPPESVEFTLHLWEVEYWLKDDYPV